jgi:hypothetical protein
MFVQLAWACRGKTCFLVQQQDGSYQSVWNASPEQQSLYMDIINKRRTTVEDTSQSSSSSKTEISPWLW